MKEIKKKNIILVLLLSLVMMMSSVGTVLAMGTSDTPGALPAKEGGTGERKFKEEVRGKHGKWDKDKNAIKVEKKYQGYFRSSDKSNSELSGISNGNIWKFYGGKTLVKHGKWQVKDGVASRKTYPTWKWSAKMPGGQISKNSYYLINLSGKMNSDGKYLNSESNTPIKINYSNYAWYDTEENRWKNIDIEVTLHFASHKKAINGMKQARQGKKRKIRATKTAPYKYINVPFDKYDWGEVDYYYSKTQPLIYISKKCYGGFPRIEMYNIANLSLKTKFTVKDGEGNNTGEDIVSNVTYSDIDNNQALGFSASNAEVTAVSPNSKLAYVRKDDLMTFTDTGITETNLRSPDNAVSFAYTGNRFQTVYTSNQYEYGLKATKNSDGSYSYETVKKSTINGDSATANGHCSMFATHNYSMFLNELPDPTKRVSDKNEPLVEHNTLDKTYEDFSYSVNQIIPNGWGEHDGVGWNLKSFEFKDNIEDCLSVNKDDIKILLDRFDVEEDIIFTPITAGEAKQLVSPGSGDDEDADVEDSDDYDGSGYSDDDGEDGDPDGSGGDDGDDTSTDEDDPDQEYDITFYSDSNGNKAIDNIFDLGDDEIVYQAEVNPITEAANISDITKKFDISVDNGKIVAKAKTGEDSILKSSKFYGKGWGSQVIMQVNNVRIKPGITIDRLIEHGHVTKDDPYIKFPNKALRSASSDTYDWNNVETNEVTTKVKIPKPKKNAPLKWVSDSDGKTLTGEGEEKYLKENTLRKADNKYTYHVTHQLGDGNNTLFTYNEETDTYRTNAGPYAPYWYFKSYKITDKVEDLLNIQDGSAKVYQYNWNASQKNKNPKEIGGRKDVTSDFDIAISADKKTVTATAKPGAIAKGDFYNIKMYEMEFDCKIETEKYDDESKLAKWALDSKHQHLKWPNKATVNITDNVDPDDPDSEDGKGAWSKDTDTVNTNILMNIDGDPNRPGISIIKDTDPYEFQVGEEIPYTIKLRQTNEHAVSYNVRAKDIDFPKGFHIHEGTLKAELEGRHGKREGEFKYEIKKEAAEDNVGDGFTFHTDYLYHGETIKITFKAKADKTLNGTVVPNTAKVRSWATHDSANDENWDKDDTSVYINSPKMKITKTMDKKPDENGKINVNSHTPITFTSVITNVNPGTFMRNLYVYDMFETDGLKVSPKDVTVTYIDSKGRKTDLEEFDNAYVIQTINKSEAASLGKSRFDEKLGSKTMDEFEIKTSDETAENTGDQLPKANYSGFLIKFLGKYRNLGYADPEAENYSVPTIPATEDKRGKDAKYLTNEMKDVEADQTKYGSSAYSTDYANLNLQGKLIVTYKAYAEEDGLKDINNFIKVPTTENTNNHLINNDDDLFTEGDPKVASGGDFARLTLDIPVNVQHIKDVQEKKYVEGDTLHYTVKSENKGTEQIKNVVLSDVFTTKNAEYHKDSFVLKIDDKDITDKCEFDFAEDNMSVTIKTHSDLEVGEAVTMTYTAKAKAEGDKIHNVSAFKADNAPELTAEKDIPKGGGEGGKGTKTPSTTKGKKVEYEAYYLNNDDETWRNVFFEDEITSKNAKYNDDFKVWIEEEEITESCKVTIDNDSNKAKVETGRDLPKGKKIRTTYSVTALDYEQIDNQIVFKDPEHASDLYKAKVPPVDHEKNVLEDEHDGPDGNRAILHYTITTKHNGKEKSYSNPVIKDNIYSKNMTYGDIEVYRVEGKAPGDVELKDMTKLSEGEGYHITVSEDKMSFEIKLKDDLKPGDIIKTVYTGHVKDREQVDNRTIFLADGINEIIDDEHVPGPDGPDPEHFVTVYKSSDPVTDSKVNAGDTITYKLKAVNTSAQTIKYIHIRDYIPEGTTFESVQNEGAFVKEKNYCEWVVKDLKPGGENARTVTFKVKVNTKNTPKHIYNHALYNGMDNDPGNPGTIKDDPGFKTEYTHHFTEDPAEEEKRTNLTAIKSCDPVSGSEVKVGDNIKYFITMENKGNKDAVNAGIRDYIPKGTQFVSAGQNGKFNEKKNCVDWNNLKVEHGKSMIVEFTVKVLESAKERGKVVNQALYQDEWTDLEKDPSCKTNNVVHYLKMTDKGALASSSQKDKNLAYTGTFTNNKEKPAANVRLVDTIKTKNAKYNNDFAVSINDKDTKDFSVEIKGYTATVKLKNPVASKAVVKMTYSVKAENDQSVNNELIEIDDEGKSDPDEEDIPGIEHVKSVKEEQHDGPEGQINTLHYTLDSKNNGKHEMKNVVITDTILSKNLAYNKDIKVIFDGKDITSECKISYTDFAFKIETGKNLAPGKTIQTKYSGKVTNKGIVSNETVLTADGIDGIKDQEHVPGPEDGVYVTTRKTSQPPSGTVVKEGEKITYILTVTNTGKDVSKFTQVRDSVPEGTIFDSVLDGGAFVKDKNYCEWVVRGLKPNQSKSVRFVVSVNKDAPAEIWNVAYYKTYPEDPGKPGEIPADPDKRTEETIHYTNEDHPKHVLLRAVKSCDPPAGSKVKVGQTVDYSITLENYGDKDTKTAGIRDYIPEGTEFVSAKNNGKYNKEKNCIDWTNLPVKAKGRVSVTFTVKVTGKALKKGAIENQALYQNDWEDLNKDPSSSTNIVEHPVAPAATVQKVKGSLKHFKKALSKFHAKGKAVKYVLTTKVKGTAKKVVITDIVKTKNLKYDKKSFKVIYNRKAITKKVRIKIKRYAFIITTNIDAKDGDVFKVQYQGKPANRKKIDNISTAKGKNTNKATGKATVRPDSPKVKTKAKTGDSFMPQIAGLIMIIAALISMLVLFATERKNNRYK